MKWAILLYGLGISGGANVIFEHALYAFRQGDDITFITLVKKNKSEYSWHEGTDSFHYMTLDEAKEISFDVAIATEWKSAFDVGYIDAKKYFYFVQSIESRFFYNSNAILPYIADSTYNIPFNFITEATWIREYLRDKYNIKSHLTLNGIDKCLFTEQGKCVEERRKNHIRFLVEGSVGNWLKNVPKTIELLNEAGAEEIWLVTPDNINSFAGVNKVFSKVSFNRMPEIYRSCDILVKLSLVEGMFGPPLEMFHCGGTAITYDIDGAEEYLTDGFNSIVVKINDEASVVSAIKMLMNNQDKLDLLKRNAVLTAAKWNDWNLSSRGFYKYIETVPVIEEMKKAVIKEKCAKGAEVYRRTENLLGIEPYQNRTDKLSTFANRTGVRIFLYGAGNMCKSTIILISKYDVPIEGILISDKCGNPGTVMGHKVMTLDSAIVDRNKDVIYITSEKYYTEIYNMLLQAGFKNVI